MTTSSARWITLTWLLLVILTLFGLGAGHLGMDGLAVNGLVLAVAFAKGRWMLLDFLKLRGVPTGWRTLFLSWLAFVMIAPWLAAAIPLLRS